MGPSAHSQARPSTKRTLLRIAERARDMSANSLGPQHPAYPVALQNLGLYYDAIANRPQAARSLRRYGGRARSRLTVAPDAVHSPPNEAPEGGTVEVLLRNGRVLRLSERVTSAHAARLADAL